MERQGIEEGFAVGSNVFELSKVFLAHDLSVFFSVFLQLRILANEETELPVAANLLEPGKIVFANTVMFFQFFAQLLLAAVGVDDKNIVEIGTFHTGRPPGIGGFRGIFSCQNRVEICVSEVVVCVKVFRREAIVR